jgi:hypothetical protein
LHGQPVSAVRALLAAGGGGRLQGHVHPLGSPQYLPKFLTLERPNTTRADNTEQPRGDDEMEIIEVSFLDVISPAIPPPPGPMQRTSVGGLAARPSTVGGGERGGAAGRRLHTASYGPEARTEERVRCEEEVEASLESEIRAAAVACMASWAVVSLNPKPQTPNRVLHGELECCARCSAHFCASFACVRTRTSGCVRLCMCVLARTCVACVACVLCERVYVLACYRLRDQNGPEEESTSSSLLYTHTHTHTHTHYTHTTHTLHTHTLHR